MRELIVSDGSEISRLSKSGRRKEMFNCFTDKVRNLLLSMNISNRRKYLLRTVMDRSHDNFGGIDSLLRRCQKNGHDRTTKDKPCLSDKYLAEQSLWAKRIYSLSSCRPYANGNDFWGEINIGLLVLNEDAYTKKLDVSPNPRSEWGLFLQENPEIRRQALLGVILLDTKIKKHKLQELYLNLDTAPRLLVERIHQSGYFRNSN
ncbi:hypothetical protein JW851_00575 [Candidatus Woesearchaeota archaeon]|nr:hypothetical protein [Candidatus Woesearchaeota archaeon]